MKKSKIDWPNHFFEFVTVVVGILLAFALNNWNENRKEGKLAEVYLESIRLEMEQNLEEVEEKLYYHSDLLKKLQENPGEVILIIKGAKTENYAWNIGSNSVLRQHIDFELYKSLAEIYSIQEVLEQNVRQASENMTYLNLVGPYHMMSMYGKDFDVNELRIIQRQSWIPIFEDMTYYESMLVEQYRKTLTEMK